MRALARSVKVGSLALWSTVLTLTAALGFVGSGCIIIDEHDEDEWEDDGFVPPPDDTVPDEPMLAVIDADAVISAEPGEGVGLFVEYKQGGSWHLWTSCDTNYSGVSCAFDVVVSVDTASEIIDVVEEGLEDFDQAGRGEEPGTAFLVADTDSGTDGATIETTPGAILRVDLLLDGKAEPRFIYWFGDGVLHQGAPTNPIDLEPNTP